jgi:protein-L-isoaspartate(D-aspartate) O-methyltransferase
MVSNQLLTHHVCEPSLINALQTVPRHHFVPERLKHIAYTDGHIALNNKRSLIAPGTLARMVQAANIDKKNTVLDVACGSGYSTAIIAKLAKRVVGVESDDTLASKANSTLKKLKINNAIIIGNELTTGHPESGPYDIIFVNGAIEELPESWRDQLKTSGRIITAVADTPFLNRVICYQRKGNTLEGTTLFETVLPHLKA